MHTGRSSRFRTLLNRLPPHLYAAFLLQEQRLAKNPHDPRLHLKKLGGRDDDAYSIRVAGSYRALFIRDGSVAFFFDIAHRKDIYR